MPTTTGKEKKKKKRWFYLVVILLKNIVIVVKIVSVVIYNDGNKSISYDILTQYNNDSQQIYLPPKNYNDSFV